MTKTQLSTIVSRETRLAYTRLTESTGVSLTDILTAAVPLLERHYRQAETVVGYVQLNRWGDINASAICPECGQPFGLTPPEPPEPPEEKGPHDDFYNPRHRPRDMDPSDMLPWVAVRANGATCAPVCYRCATSE